MRRRSWIVATLTALLASGALSACGSDGVPDSAADRDGTASGKVDPVLRERPDCNVSPTAKEMLSYRPPKAKQRYKVTLMEVSLAGYHYQGLAWAATEAAKEAGVDLDIVAASGYVSPGQQLEQMQNVIAKQPDAILFSASDPNGSVPAVKLAEKAGIPVINLSAEVESDVPTAFVLQDEYENGRIGADQLSKLVPEGGKGIVQGGPANALWSRRRVQGFKDRIAEKYPNLEIVDETNQLVDPAEGVKDFNNAVQANPTIDWIYSVYIFLLPPDGVPAQYRDVPYVTHDYEPLVIEGLRDGVVDATAGAGTIPMGRYALGAAVEKLNGGDPPRMTCIPSLPFTKESEGKPVTRIELYPEGYKAQG